jgi:hypothetical protein
VGQGIAVAQAVQGVGRQVDYVPQRINELTKLWIVEAGHEVVLLGSLLLGNLVLLEWLIG